MVSPRDVPLPLQVLRPGTDGDADARLELALTLRPYPLEIPKLPGPPKIGEPAPTLPAALVPVGASELPAVSNRPLLLFFWATWCGRCKAAVPEVVAFADACGIPVLAISDEDADTVVKYLNRRKDTLFDQVAVDTLRKSLLAHGVSGTPTIVAVDARGNIGYRQVGYSAKKGLRVNGWTWTKP